MPFLTTKHSLEYCVSYAERAYQHGFRSLVVLGGDKSVGPKRVVSHAWQLRELLHEHNSALELGGWANPHADPERQVDFLVDEHFCAEFYLTQVVSHYDITKVSRFLEAADKRGFALPGLFGVFYYRSANRKTLDILKGFLPVPTDGLIEEFGAGASADDICARTIRALLDAGVKHFYISNLPVGKAHLTLANILEKAGLR